MTVYDLEPKNVFSYFAKLSEIPHASGNMKAISDYCVEFAKEHKLSYIQDEHYNVIIKKPASKGYENATPVIIQGHLDMVAEKILGSDFDFSKDGLKLMVDNDMLYAKDTTLGGDDGIAIAYALAVLADENLKHPPIEAVFTIDEEIGLIGANLLDTKSLQGKYLLNIDSEEEGVLLTSCAGGISVATDIKYETSTKSGVAAELTISGLLGGHSGVEIHKNRANANKILGDILLNIKDYSAVSYMEGGKKDNAITREAFAKLIVNQADVEKVKDIINALETKYIDAYKGIEENIKFDFKVYENATENVINIDNLIDVAGLMFNSKNGVIAMSKDVENLVETSMNLGILEQKEECIHLVFSLRSSIEADKYALLEELTQLAKSYNATVNSYGAYPGWAFNSQSKLRPVMENVYKKLYNKDIKIDAVHAGLECGIFVSKIPELDAVSFGPDIFDIHTPQERLSISSTKRTYEYLTSVLEALIDA